MKPVSKLMQLLDVPHPHSYLELLIELYSGGAHELYGRCTVPVDLRILEDIEYVLCLVKSLFDSHSLCCITALAADELVRSEGT